MQLSDWTLQVLKNYSSINNALRVRQGNELVTLSTDNTILSCAQVDEEFPVEFSIYELHKLLGTFSLFEGQPTLDFHENFLEMQGAGNGTLKYVYTPNELIKQPKKTKIDLPEPDLEFTLTNEQLSKVKKSANVLGLKNIFLISDSKTDDIFLRVGDSKDRTSNTFSLAVGKSDKSFSVVFSIENLKIIDGDYSIKVARNTSGNMISQFSHSSGKINYWIAVESGSEIND
jgi:hypothetical protein